jgi:hypothetical protein
LEHSGNVLGTFREHGNIQRTFKEHSGNIKATWEQSGNSQGTFREQLGNIQGAFRERSRDIQGTIREKSGPFRERTIVTESRIATYSGTNLRGETRLIP